MASQADKITVLVCLGERRRLVQIIIKYFLALVSTMIYQIFDMPIVHTRGNTMGIVGFFHDEIAPILSLLLLNWYKTPSVPQSGPTWGRWGMTLIVAEQNSR